MLNIGTVMVILVLLVPQSVFFLNLAENREAHDIPELESVDQ